MRFFAVALIFFGVAASYAQTPEVPHKMHFAGMTLTIRDDARREIQKDVDALTKSPKYFGIKVERAKTYFPIIEKIFEEERLPEDFKYLALQESALIPDAVSVSDAVGFWQFKDFTAMEMGLRVDKHIDERMNIVSSSRAAARYLKQNNYMFNNWIFALQAYQMGAGGVKRVVGDDLNGAKHMDITSDTYWYVKKFLAHKVAFEDAVKGEPQLKMQVLEFRDEKKLNELARQMAVDESELLSYNKWIRSNSIPDDKTYALLVPSGKISPDFSFTVASSSKSKHSSSNESSELIASITLSKKEINGIEAVKGVAGLTTKQMADKLGISISSFLKYNDIKIDHLIRNDVYYFKSKKKSRSGNVNHTVVEGENLWLISQNYGVSLKRLAKLNKIDIDENLDLGDVVWLNSYKPTINTSDQEVAVIASASDSGEGAYFNWEVTTNAEEKGILKTEENRNDNLSKNKNEQTIQEKNETVSKIENNSGASNESNKTINDQPENIIKIETPDGHHMVSQGETLYSISRKYNVAVVDLLKWNELDINIGIKPGQDLTIIPPTVAAKDPASSEKSTNSLIMHEVKPSDTLYSVARQYNVSIKEIMDWNGKGDFSLSLGEKLKIYPH